jgi:hypothetical protein
MSLKELDLFEERERGICKAATVRAISGLRTGSLELAFEPVHNIRRPTWFT